MHTGQNSVQRIEMANDDVSQTKPAKERRDTSHEGKQRRETFEQLLKDLSLSDADRSLLRERLLVMMRGKSFESTENESHALEELIQSELKDIRDSE